MRHLPSLLLMLTLVSCASSNLLVESEPWSAVGTSVEDQPLNARTLGNGPRRVYLIGSIHGDENDGGRYVDDLCNELLRTYSSPLTGTYLRVLRDLNPDGTRAATRTNANGVDLNRNWPASNYTTGPERGDRPLSEPEVAAVHEDIVEFDPELVIVLHASRRGPFVNYDGPAEHLAEVFSNAAHDVDPRWHAISDMGYPTPGSFGTWAGIDQELPVLTIEFERGHTADSAARSLYVGVLATLRAFIAAPRL